MNPNIYNLLYANPMMPKYIELMALYIMQEHRDVHCPLILRRTIYIKLTTSSSYKSHTLIRYPILSICSIDPASVSMFKPRLKP